MTNGDGDDTNNQGGQSNDGRRRRSLLEGLTLGQSSTSRDPLERYQEILADDRLSEYHKGMLTDLARKRFRHRQIMAYIALASIVLTIAVVLGGAALGITGECQQASEYQANNFISDVAEAGNLIGGANALLAAIVASYFGVTSFRPSS